MTNNLENDPAYLKTLLVVTRERLMTAMFTITELEASISLAAQRATDTTESDDKKEE